MADPQPKGDETASFAEWRSLVERALAGGDFSRLQHRTRDGITIEPLYPRRPGATLLSKRSGLSWKRIQLIDHENAEQANAQALEDIRRGADGLALRFEGASGGGLPNTADQVAVVLEGVDLGRVDLRIEPHPDGPVTVRRLAELVLGRGHAPERMRITFGLDPVGLAAIHGGGAAGPEAFVENLLWLRSKLFQGALAEIDGRPVHEAGGSEAQELAFIVAAAAWWLRALERRGIAPADALPCFGATLAVDHEQFLSIAKLRALRLLWRRFLELCDAEPMHLRIHAVTSRRVMTRADPHTNLVRGAIAAFAAAIGGADSIAVLPFTIALAPADRQACALALNTQHLMIEEAQLYRVADPAAGSGAVEALTDAFAERAWAEFQLIEQEGGILQSLSGGGFPGRVTAARTALGEALRQGKAQVVGVTTYRASAGAAETGTPPQTQSTAGPLQPVSLEDMARAA